MSTIQITHKGLDLICTYDMVTDGFESPNVYYPEVTEVIWRGLDVTPLIQVVDEGHFLMIEETIGETLAAEAADALASQADSGFGF